jgi:predicted Fe-Mo cluster-binding NifX family protein
MKIAIPLDNENVFSAHYGAATRIGCFLIDSATRKVRKIETLYPVASSPCAWPDWLHQEEVTVLLAGGIGAGARERCAALGIEVLSGVPSPVASLEALVASYLAGSLTFGESPCQHGDQDGHHSHDPAHEHAHHGHCQCSH